MQSLQALTFRHTRTWKQDASLLVFPVPLAAAVGQLQHLTHLSVNSLTPAGALLLPASLEALQLSDAFRDDSDSLVASSARWSAASSSVSFTHLTARYPPAMDTRALPSL
jgi:hypothetical protein